MNNDVIDIEIEDSDTQPEKKHRPFFVWLLILIVILASGFSVAMLYQRSKASAAGDDIAARLLPLETEFQSLQAELADVRKRNGQLQANIQTLQAQQQSLAVDMQKAFREENSNNNDWTLAEIEHLLIVANHRLKLERNVKLALAAMLAADERLKNNDDPGLLSVRRQLTTDINSLRAVASVDISGLTLYLSDLVERVFDLPLHEIRVTDTSVDSALPEQDPDKLKQLMSSIWLELKSLVQISREGEETIATLMPQQRYFLYQNLRLQLESTRFAVLRRDTQNFHVSLGIIMDWLNQYFDTRDSAVDSVLESLKQMSDLELQPDLPDIASSLETVRAYSRVSDETGEEPEQSVIGEE
ncbi:MAG: hypothetical protein GKR93_04215 [Gammaproteobacteria bacterium]|nr:hypothetical protein [Gammaproteobacteria bacterium]